MATFNANTTLEEGELEQSICGFTEKSWYEECENAEEAKENMTVSTLHTVIHTSVSIIMRNFHCINISHNNCLDLLNFPMKSM